MVNKKINEIISSYGLEVLFNGYVCVDVNDIKKEIKENYVTINFNVHDSAKYAVGDIKNIITMSISSKKSFIESNNLPGVMFYMWYAEQSMSLSYCIISNIAGRKLPFGREVVIIEDMEPVIQKFLVGISCLIQVECDTCQYNDKISCMGNSSMP